MSSHFMWCDMILPDACNNQSALYLLSLLGSFLNSNMVSEGCGP